MARTGNSRPATGNGAHTPLDRGGLLVAGGPVVMLTGRANVGKSTLFNRLVGRGRAIVSPIAGTTRDLNIAPAVHNESSFLVVDSGGLEPYADEPAAERATEEALRALSSADVIV